MDIKKLSADFSNRVVISNRDSGQSVATPAPDRSSSGEQAVKASVVSDFEATQRAKVASIAGAVREGTYRQPNGRDLASSVLDGIGEVIELVGGNRPPATT